MLTQDQEAALVAFAARHGRCWKSTLQTMWINGRDASEPEGSTLRRIRNQFGSAWLQKYKLPA
jgi:hypothetical protein